QITPDLIKYLESLARITLTEDEEKKVGAELQDILTYIDMLNELDTQGVEAMSHCFPVTNVMREDEVQPSMTPDEITANAPESQDGCFVVPKTVD
ncbi:MAG: Asp-tRNA(Asn)/Glu-tRNA(Gln) amidotransferase subunit GatC, partial [Eubacterium sp.]